MTRESDNEIVYPNLFSFRKLVELLIEFKEQEAFSEDIPPFDTRYAGKLESILEQIQSNLFGQELYPGVVEKAVWLFYCLIKNHPFFNGNKRVAIIALFEFLANNVNELAIPFEGIFSEELYEMAIYTAESLPEEMETVKNNLRFKIESFILTS